MTRRIHKNGSIIIDKKDKKKKWLPVLIDNEALSMINKIILHDTIDEDDFRKKAIEKDVHEDCLELFKEFN